jgi:hypothetical protein
VIINQMTNPHKNTPANRGRLAGKQKRYMDDRHGTYDKDLLRSDLEPEEYAIAYHQAYHKTELANKPRVLKTSTTVYCCLDLLNQAKDLNINRSKVFEDALKIAIKNNLQKKQ